MRSDAFFVIRNDLMYSYAFSSAAAPSFSPAGSVSTYRVKAASAGATTTCEAGSAGIPSLSRQSAQMQRRRTLSSRFPLVVRNCVSLAMSSLPSFLIVFSRS